LKDQNRFSQVFLWTFLALVLSGVGLAFLWTSFRYGFPGRAGASLPIYGKVPDFSLVTSGGKKMDLADLRDKVWVADFIFTRCAGQCPLMSGRMEELQEDLSRHSALRFVSFTVDPSWDNAQVLSRYAQRYHARAESWLFLTGAKEAIYRLAREGFRLGVEESGGSTEEPIIHSSRFILVDGRARIRGLYNGKDEDAVEKLKGDIRALLDKRL